MEFSLQLNFRRKFVQFKELVVRLFIIIRIIIYDTTF